MTFAAITLYFESHPRERKAALIALGLLASLAIYLLWAHYERGVGKEQGRKDAVAEVAHDTAATVATATNERDSAVDKAHDQFDAAAVLIAAKDESIAAKNQTIAILLAKISDGRQRAKDTPDNQLDAKIDEALGEPASTPHAKRRILDAVTTVGSLSDALTEVQDKQKEQDEKIAGLQSQVAARTTEAAAERKFGDTAYTAFVVLYNAQGLKKRTWKPCLKLWHCGRDRVNVPSPADLAKEKPKHEG